MTRRFLYIFNGYNNTYENLTLPAGLATGDYYLFIKHDPDNKIEETNEDNNVTGVPFKVIPSVIDLYSQVIRTPRVIAPGQPFVASYYFNSTYPFYGDTVYYNYYLSKDTLRDTSDYFSGSIPVSIYGAYQTVEAYLSIPYIDSGKYYLIAITDGYNRIPETNEENNINTQPVFVGTPFNDVASYYQMGYYNNNSNTYEALSVFSNEGTNYINYLRIGYYISYDSILDPTDVFLKESFNYPYVYPGGTFSRSESLTIPRDRIAGNYYILTVYDYQNEIAESDESNNVSYGSFYFPGNELADLTFIYQTSAAKFVSSPYVDYTFTIKNQGLVASVPTTGYFNVYTPSGTYITNHSYQLRALKPGESENIFTGFFLPSEGVYYLNFGIDDQNLNAELDKNNNYGQDKVIYVSLITSTESEQASSGLKVSNITEEQSLKINNIDFGKEVNYYLYNELGQVVWNQENATAHEVQFNYGTLAKGIYILSAVSGSKLEKRKVTIF